MTAPERDLLTGLAAIIAPIVAAPGSPGPRDDSPDETWGISVTRGGTDPLGRWGQAVLTLTTRGYSGQPLSAHDVADPIVQLLNGLHAVTFGGVTVNDCQHRGSSSGLDASKRPIRADSFLLDLDFAH